MEKQGKRWNWKFVIGVIVGLFILGIIANEAEEAAKDGGNEPPGTEEQTDKEQTDKEQTQTDEKDQEEEEKKRQEEEKLKKEWETTYVTTVMEQLDYMAEGMGAFSDMNNAASNDPLITLDSDFLSAANTLMDVFNTIIENLRTLTPPDNLQTFHGFLMLSVNELEHVTENWVPAIEAWDVDRMISVSEALQKSNEYLQMAMTELEEYFAGK